MEKVGQTEIRLLRGDITRVGGGVIVTPTNSTLDKLPGLSSIILDAGGNVVFTDILSWKRENGPLRPGDVAVTASGNLMAIRLFHSFIPPFNKNDPEPLVRTFVLNLLQRAEEMQFQSICIPCLPKDVFGFTPEQCAYGYLSSAMDYINVLHQETTLREIKFICKDKKTSKPFEKEADRRFGVRPKKSIFSFGKKKKSKDRTGNEIELGGEEKIDS